MKNTPLVSFCISTYKRPEILKKTLNSILIQKYDNIEIVISDNDSEGSAREVIEQFNSPKIIYNVNSENLGMVKSFNRSFKNSKGDFIVFITDDDPLEPDMLETLMDLYIKYPDYDVYYGGCFNYINDKNLAKQYGLNIGKNSQINKEKKEGEITFYEKEEFLKDFLGNRIFNYFLWSTGIVKREIVEKVGGMPDYGSPFFTDYGYIGLIGSIGKTVIINKALGGQTIHNSNFGRSRNDIGYLIAGIRGFYDLLKPYSIKFNYEKLLEIFISDWIMGHLFVLKKINSKDNKNIKNRIDNREIIKIFKESYNEFEFLKRRRFMFYLAYYFPFLKNNLTIGVIKKFRKLIFR